MSGGSRFEETLALLPSMGEEAIGRILALAAGRAVDIVRPPRSGLVMMRCSDACGSDFYLGEVLVTEATVRWNGHQGYGMVSGDRPRWALAAAAVDLWLSTADTALDEELSAIIAAEQLRLAAQREQEARLIARTRVSFDLMAGQ